MTPKESFEPLNRRTARSIRALQAGKALKLKKHDVLVTSFFNFQCRRRASRKISICRIGLGDYRFEVKKIDGLGQEIERAPIAVARKLSSVRAVARHPPVRLPRYCGYCSDGSARQGMRSTTVTQAVKVAASCTALSRRRARRTTAISVTLIHLPLLLFRVNRVPVIPISFRNRFLALAPTIT